MASESDQSPVAKGRSWSLVDIGAGVAVLLAVAGVIWSPKLSGAVAQATGGLTPVTVLVDVRGVPVADPAALIQAAQQEGKVAIVIRNQPHGSVALKQVLPLQRRLVAVQPNGSVVTAVDPNQATLGSLDARFVLQGHGLQHLGSGGCGGAGVEVASQSWQLTGQIAHLASLGWIALKAGANPRFKGIGGQGHQVVEGAAVEQGINPGPGFG